MPLSSRLTLMLYMWQGQRMNSSLRATSQGSVSLSVIAVVI